MKQKIKLFWIKKKPPSISVHLVSDIIKGLEQLEDLVATTDPLRPHASTDEWEVTSGLMRNQKLLRFLKTGIDKAYGTVR